MVFCACAGSGRARGAARLARFGRTAAEHVLDGVQARLAAPRNPGMQANVAGLWNLRGGGGYEVGYTGGYGPGRVR